jgi:hypothetical protein
MRQAGSLSRFSFCSVMLAFKRRSDTWAASSGYVMLSTIKLALNQRDREPFPPGSPPAFHFCGAFICRPALYSKPDRPRSSVPFDRFRIALYIAQIIGDSGADRQDEYELVRRAYAVRWKVARGSKASVEPKSECTSGVSWCTASRPYIAVTSCRRNRSFSQSSCHDASGFASS